MSETLGREIEHLAVYDRYSPLTHIALCWDEDLEYWFTLALGRCKEEIEDRVTHWRSKGTTGEIRVYELAGHPTCK